MSDKMITKINEYNDDDLLKILGLNIHSPATQIEDNANTLIARMTSEAKPDIVEFLQEAKEKLLKDKQNWSHVDGDSSSDDINESLSERDVNSDTSDIDSVTRELIGVDPQENNKIKEEDFDSYINNVTMKQETQVINFNTRFRENYYGTCSTNFTIDLPEVQNKVTSMRLSSIELPLTHYTVSPRLGNNTMLIIGENSLEQTDFTGDIDAHDKLAWLLTLRDGDYDSTWLSETQIERTEKIMNEAIHHAIPGKVNLQGNFEPMKDDKIITNILNDVEHNDLVYSIDRTSKKSVFASPIDTDINTLVNVNTYKISTLRFIVDNDGNIDTSTNIQFKLGWTLGFRAAEYLMGDVNSTNDITTNTPISAVSEGTPFVSSGYAFLSINDYQNNARPSYLVAHANYMKSDNILTHLKLFTGLTYSRDEGYNQNATNRIRHYYAPVDISRLTIQIRDEFGRIVDLNNMDWSFTLAFEKKFN